jgi:elongation factor P
MTSLEMVRGPCAGRGTGAPDPPARGPRRLLTGGMPRPLFLDLPTEETLSSTAMPAANDLRKGQVIKFNGEPHLVMETQHRTPGNLRAFVQVKMRNLRYGKSLEQRFNSPDPVEVLPTDRRTLEFSYADRDTFSFMDPETFETFELTATMIGDAKNYLVAGGKAEVLFINENPVTIDLPSAVTLKITESADGVKGDTASNVQKPAVCETGLVIQVPLFIKEGEIVRVSTLDGSYMGRA